MDIIFYVTIGLMILFFIIMHAVRAGIDTSQNMKVLRSELESIKRKLIEIERKNIH